MGFLIGHTGIRFTGNYQCQERFKTIGTESSLNWFVYFCSCSKVRKTCWLWQFLTTWDGSCFNIDSHETGWLEYEMWPKLLWIWYRTCETCDMLLIHCIRRLLFLLGSGRTQSVRQKTIVFPSRKNKSSKVAAQQRIFVDFCCFLVFHHFSPRLLVPSLWSLSLFSPFDRPLVGDMARSGILGAVVLVGSLNGLRPLSLSSGGVGGFLWIHHFNWSLLS